MNKDSLKSVVKKSIAPQVILGKKLKKRQLEQEKKLKRIEKKLNLDSAIIRHLTVKYKKLDTENEFFKKV